MRHFLLTALLLTALLITGCTGNVVYDHYDQTPLSGWDKADILSYEVPALADSGWFATNLGLRINNSYPFLSMTLIVSQTVYPSQKTKTDTVACNLRDTKGNIKGQGIIFYQYHVPVTLMRLQKGDSLHVTVHHDMRREILPGISDVGISIKRMGK